MKQSVMMLQTPEELGVYLSVPFCRAKCSFCNFASGVDSAEGIERYVGLLCKEIRQVREATLGLETRVPEVVDTIYFGGGTPSLLDPEQLQRIFAALRSQFCLLPEAEVTLEAAPGQIGDALLETALELGVNRISLGVQSFVGQEAQSVGRSHTAASCAAEFERLRRAGLANVGADLIAGLPYQTAESWAQSLAIAKESGLAHLSVYMLEVDEDSRLGREVLGGGARLHAPAVPGDDCVADLYEHACACLPGSDFAQYEISNFALPGMRSRHNLKYWSREPYLGFGLDAHSMLLEERGRAVRWANAEELREYTGLANTAAAHVVSDREAFEETVFLGLRLVDGLSLQALNEFPDTWTEELAESVRMLTREGLMSFAGQQMVLTARGRLASSEVFGELLAGVPA